MNQANGKDPRYHNVSSQKENLICYYEKQKTIVFALQEARYNMEKWWKFWNYYNTIVLSIDQDILKINVQAYYATSMKRQD